MAKVKVTQLKSLIGRKKNHRLSVKGLGLKGIGDSKILFITSPIVDISLKHGTTTDKIILFS